MTKGLVLGGGGITGIAWEVGLLAGLAAAGIDLSADVIVGTSAGALVGAQLASGLPVAELYQRQLTEPTGELASKLGVGVLLRYATALLRGGNDAQARARLGHQALRAHTVSEQERRDVIAGRLPSHEWPTHQRLLITAVEAETGEAVVFDRDSGAELVDAVAASCAVPLVWPPMTVNGKRYIDGGIRSPANIDHAAGCSPVVVLAPVVSSMRRSGRVSNQIAALGPGVNVVVFSPDAEARSAMGHNVLDPAHRAPSALSGYRQAAEVAPRLQAVWSPG